MALWHVPTSLAPQEMERAHVGCIRTLEPSNVSFFVNDHWQMIPDEWRSPLLALNDDELKVLVCVAFCMIFVRPLPSLTYPTRLCQRILPRSCVPSFLPRWYTFWKRYVHSLRHRACGFPPHLRLKLHAIGHTQAHELHMPRSFDQIIPRLKPGTNGGVGKLPLAEL